MNRLKELRTQRGLLQKEVAEFLGVERTTYVKYENETSEPNLNTLMRLAEFFAVSVDYLLGKADIKEKTPRKRGVKIPVYGNVAAGIPIEAIEDIDDYEEITEEMAGNGEYFALRIKGDSMMPRILSGDVIIVRRQPTVENGELAVVMVNGNEATCKKVVIGKNELSLISFNPAYDPITYTNKEVRDLPVTILGKVVELRGKF